MYWEGVGGLSMAVERAAACLLLLSLCLLPPQKSNSPCHAFLSFLVGSPLGFARIDFPCIFLLCLKMGSAV